MMVYNGNKSFLPLCARKKEEETVKQRVISVFLAIVMLVSIFPTTGYATNEGDTTEIDTGDVSIEGTNGFGALLSTELTRNQTEATEGESEYEAGYLVTALDIVGNTATVEYNSMETAVLVVAIYLLKILKF